MPEAIDAESAGPSPSDDPGRARWARRSRRRHPLLRVMLAAAGGMLALAGCMVVVTWWGLARSEEIISRGPGAPGSRIQIGQAAPDFVQYALDNTPHRLSDYRGHLVALNFWATWCLPCRLEMAALNEASRTYRDQGLSVLAVDVEERPSMVVDFARRQGIEYTVLLDPLRKVADLYGVVGMPVTIWIDAKGTVRRVDHAVLTADRIASAVAELGPGGGAAASSSSTASAPPPGAAP